VANWLMSSTFDSQSHKPRMSHWTTT